jgi:4-diphosphocytidyl-2-C-methyl-D-erythritol kinase
MLLFPNCKINLGLDVISKRDDGYHNLKTVLFPIPWCDVLEILPAEKMSFITSGLQVNGDVNQNLCLKAYHLLSEVYKLPNIQIHLQKHIPMGAGLGGGSSDGAFMLKGLNELFELKLTTTELEDFALQLGSDCPFFIRNQSCLAEGRGELMSPLRLNLSGYYIKLVNLGIHVSTTEAFRGLQPNVNSSKYQILQEDPSSWKHEIKNDFESAIFTKYPDLSIIKEKMYAEGASYASMSGSGSTIFGLYEKEPILSFRSAKFEKILAM